MYGNPETTPGGRALKFYSSVRIDIRRGEQLKDGSTIVGNRTKAKIVKNKVAPPFRVAEFDILYGEGISKEGSLLDAAVTLDIIHKSGAWFSYGDQRIAQGRENTRKFLKENKAIAAEIEGIVRAEMMGKEMPEDPTAHDDDDEGFDDLPLMGGDE
jgi:recombination protein RecA